MRQKIPIFLHFMRGSQASTPPVNSAAMDRHSISTQSGLASASLALRVLGVSGPSTSPPNYPTACSGGSTPPPCSLCPSFQFRVSNPGSCVNKSLFFFDFIPGSQAPAWLVKFTAMDRHSPLLAPSPIYHPERSEGPAFSPAPLARPSSLTPPHRPPISFPFSTCIIIAVSPAESTHAKNTRGGTPLLRFSLRDIPTRSTK